MFLDGGQPLSADCRDGAYTLCPAVACLGRGIGYFLQAQHPRRDRTCGFGISQPPRHRQHHHLRPRRQAHGEGGSTGCENRPPATRRGAHPHILGAGVLHPFHPLSRQRRLRPQLPVCPRRPCLQGFHQGQDASRPLGQLVHHAPLLGEVRPARPSPHSRTLQPRPSPHHQHRHLHPS